MSIGKTFRHGQILRLVSGQPIVSQEELRRRLAQQKMRVTQATLSRDLQELRLVKTQEGYKPETVLPEENGNGMLPLPPLARALREFLLDIRPAENLLVLKTPPSGAQPLAAAVDAVLKKRDTPVVVPWVRVSAGRLRPPGHRQPRRRVRALHAAQHAARPGQR